MPTEHFKEAIKLYNPQNASNATIKATFVIRLKEFNKIWKDIKKSKMLHPEQHYIIQGIRGSGKSTLLTRLSIEIEEDKTLSKWLIPILFREEEYGITSLFTFWEMIAEELTEHPLYADQFTGLLDEIEAIEDQPKAAFKLLDNRLIKANKKIILFIDNLAELFEIYTENEEEMLREVLSQNNNIRIIGGSAISLEHFYDNKAPFYQFFHIITLKEINQQETITLLTNLGEYLGKEEEQKIKLLIEEEPEKIESLRRLTGGIPRTLIMLFQILIEGPRGTTFQYLEDTLDKVSPIYKHRMDDLSKQQKPIMHAIAKNWDAISAKEIAQKTRMDSKQVSAQLNQLQKQWLVEKIPTSTKNNLYAVQERFFNIWYLMRYGRRKDRKKLIWLTRFFEIWCSKNELTERAKIFHQALSKESSPRGAMVYASALINSDKLEFKERENLYNKTRSHLEQNGYSDLVNELADIDSNEYFQQGVKLYRSGEFKEAESYTRKAIKTGNKRAFLLLGYLLSELKQYEEAETNYRQAIEHGNTRAYIYLGNIFSDLKRYEEAEMNYRQAIEHGDSDGYFNLGILFRELKRYEEAETNYRQAIEYGNTNAYLFLGNLFSELKRYEEAETNYRQAIEHGNTSVYNNLGILFSELKRYEEAETNYRQAIEHGDSDGYFNLGNLFSKLKRYEEAETNYRLAIEHGDTDAYINLGILFSELKRYEEAETNYRQAIEHGDTDVYINLGHLFYELKRYKEAEDSFKQAIDSGVDHSENSLAWFYFKILHKDKKSEALNLADRAVSDDPNFACIHTLATVALWNNEIDIALENIERILLMDSWQQDINNEKDFIDLLILLLAKGQTNLFDKWQKQYDFNDKLKPLYYAFLRLVPEKYPNQLLRMGSELKETVDEIIDKITIYKERYR